MSCDPELGLSPWYPYSLSPARAGKRCGASREGADGEGGHNRTLDNSERPQTISPGCPGRGETAANAGNRGPSITQTTLSWGHSQPARQYPGMRESREGWAHNTHDAGNDGESDRAGPDSPLAPGSLGEANWVTAGPSIRRHTRSFSPPGRFASRRGHSLQRDQSL